MFNIRNRRKDSRERLNAELYEGDNFVCEFTLHEYEIEIHDYRHDCNAHKFSDVCDIIEELINES